MKTETKNTEIVPENTTENSTTPATKPSKIVTDIKVLGQISTLVSPDTDDAANIIKELKENIPEHALGLAAPQLGIFKRMFMANLSKGQMVFINPIFTWLSPDKNLSTEGCLSVPGHNKTISRHAAVRIKGVVVTNDKSETEELFLKGLDAFIVQHEMDHIDGKLIVDYPSLKSHHQIVAERIETHTIYMHKKRHNKKAEDRKKLEDHINRNSINEKNFAEKERRNKNYLKNQKKRIRKRNKLVQAELQETNVESREILPSENNSSTS